MKLLNSQTPSAQEHTALLEQLGPLPLQGMAWPQWVKIVVLIVLIVIGIQIIRTATNTDGQTVNPVAAASILTCFAALMVMARFMAVSQTKITRDGIEQSWITRRFVAWDDIQFVKFVPLLASKRLICFTGRGRPVVFQAGTRELHIAFARIALVYQRR